MVGNDELIQEAASLVSPLRKGDSLFADVGCALLSRDGRIFKGVCASAGSFTFCAEKIAIGAMLTEGGYLIDKIVSVWKDDSGRVFVIPPCGSCRQLMLDIEKHNLDAQVILDKDKVVSLKGLLPYHDWWKKIDF